MSRYDPYKDEEIFAVPEDHLLEEHVMLPEENRLDISGPAEEEERGRFSFAKQLLGSAFRGGAIVLSLVMVTAGLVLAEPEELGENASRLSGRLSRAKRPVFEKTESVSAEDLAALWNGDENAPHDYDLEHPVRSVEPTCGEDGFTVYRCAGCGEEKTVTVPKLGHTPLPPEVLSEKEATCAEEGLKEEIVRCADCGEEIERKTQIIPAKGHMPAEPVRENETASSCTEAGSYVEIISCSVCGAELSRTLITHEALGHEAAPPVIENEVPSTCTAEGSHDEVSYCARCGEELERKKVALPLAEHSPGPGSEEIVTAASCVKEGLRDIVIRCEVCGEELERRSETIAALGHSPGEAKRINEIKPSCTEDGSYEIAVYCAVCGEELSRESFSLVARGHDYEERVTAPTCTMDGYTEHVCSRCGDSYRTDETEALGHYFELGWNEEAPTRCSRCGTNAVTIKYNGDNTFAYTINSGFAAQISQMGEVRGEMYILDSGGNWLSAESVFWSPGAGNKGTVYINVPPGYIGPISCHLCFMFYNRQQEYMVISPSVSITEYNVMV